MIQKDITVQKTARYFILGEPSDKIERVWFVCHGYAELANYFLKKFEVLNDGKTLIVAPEALNRFYWMGFSGRVGASWMTKEDRKIDIKDYVNYLDQVYAEVMSSLNTKNVQTITLGFSQGAATVGRWLVNKKSPMDRLILWAGNFPHDVDLKVEHGFINKLCPAIVAGKEDEYMKKEAIDKHVDLFKKHKIQHKVYYFKGKHVIDTDMLSQVSKEIHSS